MYYDPHTEGFTMLGRDLNEINPEWKLMQFTGVQDKNGRDIYEGDILKFKNHDNMIVEWSSKYANFVGKIIKTMKDEYPTFCAFAGYELYKNPEVIGNIHENKELIE